MLFWIGLVLLLLLVAMGVDRTTRVPPSTGAKDSDTRKHLSTHT